jgi:hypothetical protein
MAVLVPTEYNLGGIDREKRKEFRLNGAFKG